jgi:hypothetical protein
MASFFEQFKKQMEDKGFNLGDDTKEKTELLKALEDHVGKERGPMAHTDHSSFTRHSSHSAAKDDDKKDLHLELEKKNIAPRS